MNRIFSGILLFCLSVSGHAQSIKGEFDVSAYPEVSFVWNEYNPEIKDSVQFILSGDGEKIPFRLQHLPYSDTVEKNKTVLFLWEDIDHPSHSGQSAFARQLLYRFLQQAPARKGDRFNVAVFDRKGGNDLGSSIHTLLSKEFTSDREQLANAVRDFSPRYDFFSRQINSELYMAIDEGIELLKKEPADRVRALTVITAGSNQDNYGGKNNFADVKAVELKIPLYLVKYPIAHCQHCSNIDGISARTFGRQIETADTAIATKLLLECFDKMNERHYGQDYRISFRSKHPRDGKPHFITWNVNGRDYTLICVSPTFSIAVWIKENRTLAALAGLGCLLLTAVAVFFIFRARKRKKRHERELETSRQQQQQDADIKIEQLEESIRQTKQEYETQSEKEREAELTRIMQIKNLHPRLQYSIDGVTNSFSVIQTVVNIGRETDNHLILPDRSVSRHHARITFTGNGFEIRDLGSANKVIVNGRFVQQAALNSGDIIGLGGTVIYFYN